MDNKEKSYIQTVIEGIKERNKDKIEAWKAAQPKPVEEESGLDIDWLISIQDDGIQLLDKAERDRFNEELGRVADWCTKLLQKATGVGEATLMDVRKLRRFIWVDCMILSFGGHDSELKWPEIRSLLVELSDLLRHAMLNP